MVRGSARGEDVVAAVDGAARPRTGLSGSAGCGVDVSRPAAVGSSRVSANSVPRRPFTSDRLRRTETMHRYW